MEYTEDNLKQIDEAIKSARTRLDTDRNRHFKKLSQLYLSYIKHGLPISQHPSEPTPSILGEKPDLASTFELPPPPKGPPFYPSRQPQPITSQVSRSFPVHQNVMNLSTKSLSNVEISVLSKGLTFCPTPKPNHIKLVNDILNFCRNLRWRAFWLTHNPNPPGIHPSLLQFRPPSDREPEALPQNHPIEIFISTLLSKISDPSFLNSLNPIPNLSKEERKAINSLKSDNSIVITPADKGSTVTILDKHDYINEAYRQLNDLEYYSPLNHDPTIQFRSDILTYLKKHGLTEGLTKKDLDILCPPHPKTPHFYILPKLHKPGNPGRPIVSSISSPTERISAFLDSHLQPIVSSLPSHIRDSFHFLEILKNTTLPPNQPILMATVDVVSLYTSILHSDGLTSLQHFLSARPTPHQPSTEFLIKLAEFVLTMNAFTFENKFYHQIKGTAMGTRMAPSYANLFMGKLETEFLAIQNIKPLVWLRYIDDIFLLWPHTLNTLQEFLENLNNFSSISFTWNISDTNLSFLDINISLQNNSFSTSIHEKPSNFHQYLHFTSSHPIHTKRSIVRSLSSRAHKICNNKETLTTYLSSLEYHFENRAYPHNIIKNSILPANSNYIPRPKSQTDSLRITTTYFPGIQRISPLVKNIYSMFSSNPLMTSILPKPPSLSYKQPPNLKHILTNRQHDNPTETGTKPCHKPRCKTCRLIDETNYTKNPNSPTPYLIRCNATCCTRNCIYKFSCRYCSSFYIGKCTTSLNIRVNNHRHSQFDPKLSSLPIPSHANSHNICFDDCFTLQVLYTFPIGTPEVKISTTEQSCILLFKATSPPGLNKH